MVRAPVDRTIDTLTRCATSKCGERIESPLISSAEPMPHSIFVSLEWFTFPGMPPDGASFTLENLEASNFLEEQRISGESPVQWGHIDICNFCIFSWSNIASISGENLQYNLLARKLPPHYSRKFIFWWLSVFKDLFSPPHLGSQIDNAFSFHVGGRSALSGTQYYFLLLKCIAKHFHFHLFPLFVILYEICFEGLGALD